MSQFIDFKLKGGPELLALMDQLPPKIARNAVRVGVRAGVKVMQKEARLKVRRKSGALAKGLKISSRMHGTIISAKVKAKGRHSFLGWFMEYGVAPHWITVPDKEKPIRNTRRGPRRVSMGTVNKMVERKSLVIQGNFVGPYVHHKGHRAFPFMRPALDTKAKEAINVIGQVIKERLTWNNLKAPLLAIEPDE